MARIPHMAGSEERRQAAAVRTAGGGVRRVWAPTLDTRLGSRVAAHANTDASSSRSGRDMSVPDFAQIVLAWQSRRQMGGQ